MLVLVLLLEALLVLVVLVLVVPVVNMLPYMVVTRTIISGKQFHKLRTCVSSRASSSSSSSKHSHSFMNIHSNSVLFSMPS